MSNRERRTGVADEMLGGNDRRKSPYPTKKKKWEDDYSRATFYVENETLDELNYQAGNEKGKKTEIINKALQQYLDFTPNKSKEE